MAFPDTIFEKCTVKDAEADKWGRFGDISMEEVVKLANYHTVRKIQTSTDHFGWVDISKRVAVRRLEETLAKMPDRIAKIKADKGDEATYVVHIHLRPPADSRTSWSLTICGIQARIAGDSNHYYPVF